MLDKTKIPSQVLKFKMKIILSFNNSKLNEANLMSLNYDNGEAFLKSFCDDDSLSTQIVAACANSEIENAILKSVDIPISVHETEEITALGQRGIYVNKSEADNWKGSIPLSEYKINADPSPIKISKKMTKKLDYVQEIAIRYLRPPTPPVPGEIFITQEPGLLPVPAPPVIIRQQPPKPQTPEPLIIREAPPIPPEAIGSKLITISGRTLPPPPRKVVVERLPQLPSKPQSVLIERWLPYAQHKRRVIFQPAPPDPVMIKPKNIIVQWDPPSVSVRQEYKCLGIVEANPCEYVQKYGSSLTLPGYVTEIKTPEQFIQVMNYVFRK